MPKIRFKRTPKAGQTVELFGESYTVKAYKGPFILRHFLKTPPVYYINLWYVPGFIAAKSPLKYTPELAVAPPSKDVFPKVPDYEDLAPGTGYTIARSTSVTSGLMRATNIGVLFAFLLFSIFRGFNAWLALGLILIFAVLTWAVCLSRISNVHVITDSILKRHWGFWIWAKQEAVQSQDIDRVRTEIPKPQLWWSTFGVSNVIILLNGNTTSGAESFVLEKVANGDAVKALIDKFHVSLEDAGKAAANSNELILDELRLMNANQDELGRILSVSSKRMLESNEKIIDLLNILVEHLVPRQTPVLIGPKLERESNTEEIPIIPFPQEDSTDRPNPPE